MATVEGGTRCPECGRTNRAGRSFCGGCGASLAPTCPQCGALNEPGDSFCGDCGASLAAASGTTPAAAAPSVSGTAAASDSSLSRNAHAGLGPAAPARLPTSFGAGRYEVLRFLGEGAKKRVYLARDKRLGREVALCAIKREGLDADGRLRVEREARAMAHLGDHPHIVTIHDIAEEHGELYILSQYMPGGDLESHLAKAENRRLRLEEAIRIGRELCQALAYAHQAGLVHRDLKPGNVYLGDDGQARLGDFGLAVSQDRTRLTQEGMMVGTAAYMAPEQALGKPPDARCDLYSLGALLYELLTGRPPFVGDDAVSIISQHINTPPVAPSWHNPAVPRPLEDLVLALLAKDPGARPSDAEQVSQALGRITALMERGGEPAERPEANPLEGLAGGVFVGREREVKQLREGLDEALAGRGRVLMLVGEPGIGKTRTSEELATYARMRGAQVLWGRCYEGEGAPPYWPWVQIVRDYVHDRDPSELLSQIGTGAAAIAEVVSEVRQRLPGLPEASRLEPEQARFRLFDSVSTFLKNAASREPLMLVLDDLHWADKSSLLLLQFFARALAATRVLVLANYRDVELRRDHPLSQTLAALASEQLYERILLRGIGKQDIARFIEQTANVSAPAELVAAVHRETEGNPFFVHEVVRLLVRDRRLERPEGVKSWSLQIPQGVREVVGQRLDALPEETNRVLRMASAVGRDFGIDVLERVSGPGREELLQALDDAVAAQVVHEVEGAFGCYRFSHALVRETLYDELRTGQRVQLHRLIGEALEAIYGDRAEAHLAELAHHFCEAAAGGEFEKAVAYATRAAERATDQVAYEEAVTHYEHALQVLALQQPPDRARLCRLLLELGRAHGDAGDPDRAVETYRRAAAVARELGDAQRFARAAMGVGRFRAVWGWVDEELIALLEEALRLLPEGDSAERAAAMGRLVMAITFMGAESDLRRKALYAEAAAMARRVADRDALLDVLIPGLFIWSRPLDEKLADADEIVELAEEVHHIWSGWARFMRHHFHMEKPDIEAADADLEGLRRVAERDKRPFPQWGYHNVLAMRAIVAGRFEEAERETLKALELGRRANEENALQYLLGHMVTLRRAQGRTAELEGAVRESLAKFPDVGGYLAGGASTFHELGKDDEARELIERLIANDFRDQPDDTGILLVASVCAGVGHDLGHERACALAYETLEPFGERVGMFGVNAICLGAVSYYLGLCAATLGRVNEAVERIDHAIALNERVGVRTFLLQAQVALARILMQRDAPGDRKRALGLANVALAGGQDIGMKPIVERALALKLGLQGVQSGTAGTGTVHAVAHSVESRRPDMSRAASPDGTVTLVFSDIEGFTAMTERLGDVDAHRLVSEHNRIVREQTAVHGGHEVELRGDGFLLAFASARQAVHFSIALQRSLEARNVEHPEEPIRIRIGLHTGETIKDADKFFGKSVIQAFRVADTAKGGEILVSALTKQLVESAGDLRFGDGRDVTLKGLSGAHRVYPVAWS